MADTGKKPVVLIGGGGHASVLADILLRQKRDICAVISPDDLSGRAVFRGLTQLLSDQDISHFTPDEVELVNGIGMTPRSELREKLNRYYLDAGYHFTTVIADSAEVSPYAQLAEGVQVLSQAIIQAGSVVGSHTIINSRALVEHDCHIGAYSHVAPGAVLCGQVRTGNQVFIGAGAVVLPSCTLGNKSIVGAGAVQTENLADTTTLYPAKSAEHLLKHR